MELEMVELVYLPQENNKWQIVVKSAKKYFY
jgi:hypothetical protein